MTNRTVVSPVLSALVIAGIASSAHAADPSINVGATEVVGVPSPSHLGVYPYAAGSLAFEAGPGLLIPSLGLELCPELRRWGFVALVDFDVPVTPVIGLDVLVTAVHDQLRGDWGDATFSLGGGLGMSFAVDKFVVSPSVVLLGGLNVSGWAIVPGLNLSHAL